ncbi:MAG: dynamin family protein [Candidatus Hydrogenedentes bacterium]|nr:dynamin family protein [Candidatus Hydrogenedentota bacterium]
MPQTQRETNPTEVSFGAALSKFDAALRRLRVALSSDAQLEKAVFGGAEEWTNLLSRKLVPHLAGDGCLIVAVTGGTNTGKSTVFNMLLGRVVSPIVATAAATARPLVAANATRTAQCLEGKLVPEFVALPFKDADAVVNRESPDSALYVTTHDALPDSLVFLDTPDVDSIEREHWDVADAIRATGDVIIAVLTGEKYKDDRVVAFFRQALASGRVVVPVMNKANPDHEYEVARKQLGEFVGIIGSDSPCFVVPHDFALDLQQSIRSTDGEIELRKYIDSLDVKVIKQRVYRGTVAHVAQRAAEFLENAGDVAFGLRGAAREFEARAEHASKQYDPTPGAAVGGLFHEFVQSKRGLPFKVMGNVSRAFVVAVTSVGRAVRGAVVRRAALEAPDPITEESLQKLHGESIERIARDLTAGYHESVRNLREPAAHLIQNKLDKLNADNAARAILDATLRNDNVSEEFRQYAYRTLETWWNENRAKRMALQTLDGILAVAPAAFAGVIAAHTAGMGVDVALAVGGPMAEQFAARVIEYQFGDALFDFLSPWRDEQRALLENTLLEHITRPALARVDEYLEVFDGDMMSELRRLHAQCTTV